MLTSSSITCSTHELPSSMFSNINMRVWTNVLPEDDVGVAVVVDVADRHREATTDAGADHMERPLLGWVGWDARAIPDPWECSAISKSRPMTASLSPSAVDVDHRDPIRVVVGRSVPDECGRLESRPDRVGVLQPAGALEHVDVPVAIDVVEAELLALRNGRDRDQGPGVGRWVGRYRQQIDSGESEFTEVPRDGDVEYAVVLRRRWARCPGRKPMTLVGRHAGRDVARGR